MAEIKMPSGEVFVVDDEDLLWLSKYKWFCSRIRDNRKNYARCTIRLADRSLKRTSMHRLIMNAGEGFVVDHKNGNTFDNRKSNLRIATPSQNRANSAKPRNAKGSMKGVSRQPSGKWRAAITVNYKYYDLGHFDTEQNAHEAYLKAAIYHFGEFANAG